MAEQRFRYGRLWLGTVASNLGDGLVIAGFPLLAVTLTRDPIAVSGLTAAAGLPWLVFGPIAGAIVDRFDRRRLMWVYDVARAAVVAGLTLFIGLGGESLIVLYVVVFLIAMGETIVDTSSQALLPAIVSKTRLDVANGRLFSSMTVANRFIGPPLGGFLFGVAAILPVAADAASFAIAAAAIGSISGSFRPASEPGQSPQVSVRASVIEGMRWLWNHREVRTFAIGAALLNIGILAGESILVLFAQEQLGLDEVGFGALFVAVAAGYAIGSFLAPALTKRVDRLVVVVASVATISISLLIVAVSSYWGVASVGLFGVGLASGLWDVIAVSFRQAAVPDRLLGRIMAAYRVIAHGSIPIGALLGGVMARLAGNRAAFAAGVVVVLIGVPHVYLGLRGAELDPGKIG
jgi:MFS family permease